MLHKENYCGSYLKAVFVVNQGKIKKKSRMFMTNPESQAFYD